MTSSTKETKMQNHTTLMSSFIRLAYEGISSFLHHKLNKALHKVVRAMESKTPIQYNKLIQLEIQCLCMLFTMQRL